MRGEKGDRFASIFNFYFFEAGEDGNEGDIHGD